jgi:hypothetical protein
VREYIREKGYHVDADEWMAFYESNGWFVGKTKMRDWKASVRTWHYRDKKKNNKVTDEEPQGYRYKRFTDDGY